MNVALEQFASQGYYKTTITHIARHAGISKGLMYNYFESKEALLRAIIQKSVNEVYQYLDINRDGYLTEEEFEFFIRNLRILLKEKKHFWWLLMQLLLQNDVREQFLKAFPVSGSPEQPDHEKENNNYPLRMMKLLTDYFGRKKERMGPGYDPDLEVNMFLITMKGFTLNCIYMDDDNYSEKMVNKIIEMYK